MQYKPTQIDLAWAAMTVAMLADGATLALPDAMLIFTINKKEKILLLINEEILAIPHSKEVFEQTKIVFKTLGYETVLKQ